MTTTLQKAARAICAADVKARGASFDEMWPALSFAYMEMVRAALQAMRELDDATLRAGTAASWAQPEALREAHRAIIDAIINEES